MSLIHGAGALTAGLTLGTTYVLSVGPNNMMIIREGLMRGRVLVVSSTLLGSYILLLVLSYALTERLSTCSASVRTALSWCGLGAMAWFALLSIRTSLKAKGDLGDLLKRQEPLGICLRRVTVVALCNPLMYIEFLLIPAAVCGTFKDVSLRLPFIGGLIIMAAVCCYGYAMGGRACAPLLRHSHTLQVFDGICGVLLAYMAALIAGRLVLQS